jgi:hypothetical protein
VYPHGNVKISTRTPRERNVKSQKATRDDYAGRLPRPGDRWEPSAHNTKHRIPVEVVKLEKTAIVVRHAGKPRKKESNRKIQMPYEKFMREYEPR